MGLELLFRITVLFLSRTGSAEEDEEEGDEEEDDWDSSNEVI